ncbi:MAG: hypothetical protein Q9225_003173 [Loekoesia sp. 1 TL-2023]
MTPVPRLQSQLFESEIFVEVGNEHFHIPRDIFSAPGDTPNYFTLGFTVFFSSPGDVFPGLNPRGLLRPPAIHPPRIPNRSPKIFADLLHMLRGYPLTIQDSGHRQQLLKDARYYNLRGLEQKLIPHAINHNISRHVSEIVIRLQDIKPSQISTEHNDDEPISSTSSSASSQQKSSSRWITYARPYVDEQPYHLILETSDFLDSISGPISLDLATMRATLFGATKSRITNLFQTVANKLNLPTTIPLGLMMMEKGGAEGVAKGPGSTPLSEDEVKVVVDKDTHVVLDGRGWEWQGTGNEASEAGEEEEGLGEAPSPTPLDIWQDHFPLQHDYTTTNNTMSKRPPPSSPSSSHPNKRHKLSHSNNNSHINPQTTTTWAIHRGQWHLRVQCRSPLPTNTSNSTDDRGSNMEIVMVAVKIEATSGEKARNAQRGWLE